MKNYVVFMLVLFILLSCGNEKVTQIKGPVLEKKNTASIDGSYLTLLGTMQDGGQPHIGCAKKCCTDLYLEPNVERQVISLGLVDQSSKKKYLFEATPDISRQMKYLERLGEQTDSKMADGIFLTHAHIGHYAGLMFLGKEAMGADKVPVYAMPRMKEFIETNGPWSQLITEGNIDLKPLQHENEVALSEDIKVIPMRVPHRDEFSETVAYKIQGSNKSALFIPDIDKWEKWEKDIIEEVAKVDYAFLDATFYSGKELNNRDMSEIPHPFVLESLDKFKTLSKKEKNKIIFIHLNHTNPIADPHSIESKKVIDLGFRVGRIYDTFAL